MVRRRGGQGRFIRRLLLLGAGFWFLLAGPGGSLLGPGPDDSADGGEAPSAAGLKTQTI